MKRLNFRAALGLLGSVAAMSVFAQSPGQGYPNRPVRIIVPFATGGPDTVARLVGAHLAQSLGQPFVVENRPAANGIVGADAVAKAAPDGYTLLVHSSGFVGAPAIYKKLPYDTMADFTPVTNLAANLGTFLVVHPSVPANTVQEFIALAKKPESKISFSSPGIGNTLHLIGGLFNARAGIEMLHIPYKGGGPAIAAVVSGEVQAMFGSPQIALPHIRAGKIRALATTLPARAPYMPEIPTMAEAGVADMVADGGWFGMFAPAKTPMEIVNRLHEEVRKALADPGIREKLNTFGLGPMGDSPAAFKAIVADEIKKYAEMARLAGIQPE
ncbi:MAG: Bug family tripartite tricarboxylate transporter substrate binding protein [Burkholderiales bacterium]